MKIKILFLTITMISLLTRMGLVAQSQNYLWAKSNLGATYSEAHAVCTDASGNVCVAGYCNGSSMTFGSTVIPVDPSNSVFIAKYDQSGNFLWAKCPVGDSDNIIWGVSSDAFGNVYVIGSFTGDSLVFDSDTLRNSSSGGLADIFIAKYDTFGNVVWAKSAEGSDYDRANEICTDIAGNILLTGFFQSSIFIFGTDTLINSSTLGYADLFILKLDSFGNVIWAKSAGGALTENANSVCSDVFGNSYIAGYFSSASLVFGTTTLINSGTGNDIFVAKYDPSGNVLWANSAGGGGDDKALDISANINGGASVTGYFYSPSISFGGTTLTNAGGGYSDIFITKYNSLGLVLWANRFGGTEREEGSAICSDVLGNNILTGFYRSSTISLGSTTLTNGGLSDMFVTKIDTLGNFLWGKKGGGTSWDYGYDICVEGAENVYIVGGSSSPTTSFGAISIVHSSTKFYVVKLNDTTGLVWPGDSNSDHIVNNTDLLPVGLHYAQTGTPRTVMGNVWQADSSANWGTLQTNGADIKHVDCNGDGIIDNNDTLAINLNFSLTHAFSPSPSEFRLVNPDLHFTSSSGIYPPGAWVNIDIMTGTAILPVSNLYGIAFDIQYDAALVQPGTESLIYPNSWFASPGTNAIKIGKIDALANTAYGAETRINHTNADGYGKIATFHFQAKSSISSLSTLNLSYSGYMANDSAGNILLFNPQHYSIIIDPLAATIEEKENLNEIAVYPNPNDGNFNISFNAIEKSNYKMELTNALGQLIYKEELKDYSGIYKKQFSVVEYGKGVYTITLTNDKHDVIKKIIVY